MTLPFTITDCNVRSGQPTQFKLHIAKPWLTLHHFVLKIKQLSPSHLTVLLVFFAFLGINFQLPNNLSEITFHPELGRRYSYRITLLNSSEVDKYFGLSLMPFFNASCDNQMLVEEEDRTDVCISGNSSEYMM